MEGKLIKVVDKGYYNLENKEGRLIATSYRFKDKDYNSLSKLSLKNCEAVENGYDLDELAEELTGQYATLNPKSFKRGVLYGFQKALEILGDKKFSEVDVISMIEKSRETGLSAEYLILTKQQTEWDVEIEMDDAFIKNSDQYIDEVGVGNYSTHTKVPTLDIDGCLILRRI